MSKCILCQKKKEMSELYPLFKKGTSLGCEDDFYTKPKYICKSCLKHTDEYGECEMCDGTGIYHAEDLDEWKHCRDHADECKFDEEEEAGWNDMIDYWNK